MNPVLSRGKRLAPLKTPEGLPLPTLILQCQSVVNQQDFVSCMYIYLHIYLLFLGLLAFGCELLLD